MYIRVIFLSFILKLICGDNSTSDDIAQRLIDRYNDVRLECVDKCNNKKPAFQCSGLMMRGLAKVGDPGSQQNYAWSKKKSNVRLNKFSVTFLRRDQRFSSFPHGYESGFIYYPHLQTPSDKNSYRVFCAFPIDAWSDFRKGDHGCGRYYRDASRKSDDCIAQGINTLAKWTKNFQCVTKGKNAKFEFAKWQCGFDMTTKDAHTNFALVLEAKKWFRHYSRKYSWYHNELVIRAWNEETPRKLPIEAFFYIIGYSSGRDKACMYQSDYLKLTGEMVPVVGVRLPNPKDAELIVKFDKL